MNPEIDWTLVVFLALVFAGAFYGICKNMGELIIEKEIKRIRNRRKIKKETWLQYMNRIYPTGPP